MRFLIDECLHTSLVQIANANGHEGHHVNWLALSGATDRSLIDIVIEGDFTFVTNNAIDFRRLYARQPLHASLIIVIPQLVPSRQRAVFDTLLRTLAPHQELVNEVIELSIDHNTLLTTRYEMPETGRD